MKQSIRLLFAITFIGMCSALSAKKFSEFKNLRPLADNFNTQDILFIDFSGKMQQLKNDLKEIKDFVDDQGVYSTEDSKQRKADMKVVDQIWNLLLAKLNTTYKRLFNLQVRFPKDPSHLSPRDLNLERLGIQMPAIRSSLEVLTSDGSVGKKPLLEELLTRSRELAANCTGQACKDKFKLLELSIIKLQEAIASVEESLGRLYEFASGAKV